jgi:hypothetical protein
MPSIDLHAPVVPGVSAAGFQIGLLFDDLADALKCQRFVQYYDGFDLNAAIQSNVSLLRVDGLYQSGPTIYFKNDIVRLAFSLQGVLACIYVFKGYAGAYREARLGNPLSVISKTEPVEYDDGDEMFYRINANGTIIPGLAIVAVGGGSHDETEIEGFCVHDWTIA